MSATTSTQTRLTVLESSDRSLTAAWAERAGAAAAAVAEETPAAVAGTPATREGTPAAREGAPAAVEQTPAAAEDASLHRRAARRPQRAQVRRGRGAERYRRIMRVLCTEHPNFGLRLSPEAVGEWLRDAFELQLDPLAIAAQLDQLHAWGAVTREYDTALARTARELRRNRFT